MSVPSNRRVATLWKLRFENSILRCVVYHGDSGMELRLESSKSTILVEPFDMHPRSLSRTKALRESLKRRGWREESSKLQDPSSKSQK